MEKWWTRELQVEITDLARMCQGADCYAVAHDDLMTTRIAKSISILKQDSLFGIYNKNENTRFLLIDGAQHHWCPSVLFDFFALNLKRAVTSKSLENNWGYLYSY